VTPARRSGSDRGERFRPSYASLRGLVGNPDRTVVAVALAGLISCCTLTAIAGRTARVPGATPPSSWLGLLDRDRGPIPARVGAVEICAVLVLVLAWWCLLKAARRLRPRVVVAVGTLWAIPITLGPPLLSLDAYSYIAQGRLAALGIDPYVSPPQVLYSGPWLQGVDPFWRQTLSPYGPFAVLLERAVALTGSAAAALVLLHLIAFGSLALVTVVVRQFAPSNQRSIVLLLTVLNPLVLLQLLGAAHWEALMVALIAAALLAWQRGHPEAAIALASAAAAVKLPAGFALAVLLMLHVLGGSRGRRLQRTATGALAAVAPWLLLSLFVPNALGFLGALGAPLSGWTAYAPTTMLAEVVARAWTLTGATAPFHTILSVCQGGGLLVAAGVCCALLATASRRPAGTTIGLGLLVVALLGPILYPWYVAWGLVPLALSSRRYDRLLALLSSVMIFMALPGLQNLGQRVFDLGPLWVLGSAALLIVAVLVVLVSRFGHLRENGSEKLPEDAHDGTQWPTWVYIPNSWRPWAATLRRAVSMARLRTGTLREKFAAERKDVGVPDERTLVRRVDHHHVAADLKTAAMAGLAGATKGDQITRVQGAERDLTGLVPLAYSPSPTQWPGPYIGVGDRFGIRDLAR
jgi:alpha-1,6-mannosyltransferase